jgi:hypothetical protein
MQVSEKFFQLTRDEQEEVATKQSNKYYDIAERWRKLAVQARIGKTKAKEKTKKQNA